MTLDNKHHYEDLKTKGSEPMANENADFRDNLKRLDEKFTGEVIPLKEAADYLNIDPRMLRSGKVCEIKRIGDRFYVPKVALARWMS